MRDVRCHSNPEQETPLRASFTATPKRVVVDRLTSLATDPESPLVDPGAAARPRSGNLFGRAPPTLRLVGLCARDTDAWSADPVPTARDPRRARDSTQTRPHQRWLWDRKKVEWFAVRCVFRGSIDENQFEERVTLWQANSFERAVERAEQEANEYANIVSLRYLGLAQAYKLADEPGDGAEVFSLYRESRMDDKAYLDTFFDTGTEHQRHLAAPGD